MQTYNYSRRDYKARLRYTAPAVSFILIALVYINP